MKNARSPKNERNKARSLETNSMVPGSLGFPQPGGGFASPRNWSASHFRPSKSAYRTPQWVYSLCEYRTPITAGTPSVIGAAVGMGAGVAVGMEVSLEPQARNPNDKNNRAASTGNRNGDFCLFI